MVSLSQRLAESVGKDIGLICPNKFHHADENHCAHYVSHLCGINFSYHCVQYKGGTGERANIRVHEIFAQCPKVGHWTEADLNRTQLAFVTLAENVDLSRKRLENIKQKHVGIYHEGKIYHYSNGRDKVVTDTPDSFLGKFQKLYAGNQGLFFGWIPGENLSLHVKPAAAEATAAKKFDLPDPQDARWWAREMSDESPFLVGKETRDTAKGYFGLYTPVADYWGPEFRASDYVSRIGHWANLLEVTGACESGNRFNLVNTYDRAKFTFGFYQLAAHTPRDNLILLFRRLAGLPSFNDYFPELKMLDGHLHRVDADGGTTDLEVELPTGNKGADQLQFFMNYLNPARKLIERQEALQAARLIHWTISDAAARAAQVEVSGDVLQHKMSRRYAPKLGLDGASDVICAIVADIFHQGRATFSAVAPLLREPDAEARLLHLYEDKYAGRNKRLRQVIAKARDDKKLGQHRYVASLNEFQPV